MSTLRIQVRSLSRPIGRQGEDDETNRLVEMVRSAVGRGGAPAMAVVVRPKRVDLVGLSPLLEASSSLPHFFASLTRSTADDGGPPEAVGVVGAVRTKVARGGPGIPTALVFLEWADCRWWQWRCLMGDDGAGLRGETETVRCAAEGDALPKGLGRWWSLGRRLSLEAHFRRIEVTADEVVH